MEERILEIVNCPFEGRAIIHKTNQGAPLMIFKVATLNSITGVALPCYEYGTFDAIMPDYI